MKSTISFASLKTTLLLGVMLLIGSQLSAQNGGGTAAPCTTATSVSMSCPININPFGGPIALTGGLPAGGVYSGAGVANGYLDLENKSVAEFNQIVYTFTDASGCEGNDSCKYAIPCDPKVSMDAKKEVCLGDTIELFVDVDMPDLFTEYTGWPVLQQAPMPRNGRLKSDVTGYGDATMNIVFEDGQIIFKSDKPMRLLEIKLDTLQCKNLVWGKPTDLSKIASFITKEADQLWIVWKTAPFNSTVTESIIALNYTGKLPDTMTFRLNYAYYVNQNMKAVVDTLVVVFDVPDTTATIDTTETTSAEALLLQQVTVRPVPAVSDIQVNASFCISNLFIQDALGRIVNEMSGVDADELSVDISSLPQGMYFLHVLGSNGEIAHTSFNKE